MATRASIPKGSNRSPARFAWFLIPAVLFAGLYIGYQGMLKTVQNERQQERSRALEEIGVLLGQARRLGSTYAQEIEAERRMTQNAIKTTAREIADKTKDQILRAFAEDRIKRTEARLREVERQRNDVADMLQQQAKLIATYKQALAESSQTFQESTDASANSDAESDMADVDIGFASELSVISLPEPSGQSSTASTPPDTKGPDLIAEVEGDLPLSLLEPSDAPTMKDRPIDPPPAPSSPRDILLSLQDSLKRLLPAHGSIRVLDETGEELLECNSSPPLSDTPSESVKRDLLIPDEDDMHQWSTHVTVATEAPLPEATTDEYARLLSKHLGLGDGDSPGVEGMIINQEGRLIRFFPENVRGADMLPIQDKGGWNIAETESGRKAVRLEIGDPVAPCLWGVGVQMTLSDPTDKSRIGSLIDKDWRVALGISLGGLLALGTFALAIKKAFLPASHQAATQSPPQVPYTAPPRATPHDPRVLYAEIPQDRGGVRVQRLPKRKPHYQALRRLQAMHRGSPSAGSSRVLDQARSPLLRELVKRIRPRATSSPAQSSRDDRKGA